MKLPENMYPNGHPKNMTTESRREFEEWANNGYFLARQDHFPDLYRAIQTQRAWEAWQAARERQWRPIESAYKNGEHRIIIAAIHNGEIQEIDFDAVLEQEQESWELPQTYWVWKSANGRVEEPTHWMPLPNLPTSEKI
jgi:hypothetical protein